MSEEVTPTSDAPSESTIAVVNAPTVSVKRTTLAWAAVLAVALVSGLSGFAIGQHSNDRHHGMRLAANVRPMAGNDMMGAQGPHCNAADGTDVALNADGTCPAGTILSKPRMMSPGNNGMMGPGNNGMMGPGEPNRGPDPDGDNRSGGNGKGPMVAPIPGGQPSANVPN